MVIVYLENYKRKGRKFKGVCKTRTGYLRMADGGCGWENADRKMRMEKMRITKKVRGKKREMRMAKKH